MTNIATLNVAPNFYLLLAISVAVFLCTLDSSIMNTALPIMGKSLNLTEAKSVWLVTSYQMAMLALILPVSSFADRIGYKKIFMTGILIFTLGSLCCFFINSFYLLIATRVFQGIGASVILGCNTALLRLVYSSENLGKGLGYNALILALGVSFGPLLSSFVLFFTTWQWLFAINVPIGFGVLYLVYKYMPSKKKKDTESLDILATILCMLMFATFIFLIGEISNKQAWWRILCELIFMLSTAILLYWKQRKISNPLLAIDLFKNPVFSLSTLVSICAFLTQSLSYITFPFHFQNNLGKDVLEIGMLIAPWPLTAAILAPWVGKLSDKFSPSILGGMGLLFLSSGIFFISILPNNVPGYFIVICMMLCGIGFAFFVAPNQKALILSAPLHRSGAASGILGASRLIGQATGATIVAFCFNYFTYNATNISFYIGACSALLGALLSFRRFFYK